jgi:ABC-type Fe3+/spermidine/putrescine transport system ATPase subunit
LNAVAATVAFPSHQPGVQAELELTGVSRFFDGVPAVADCNLTISRGEIVALLGPSGCGKSTLLNLIAGFERPDAGMIRLRGQALHDVPPHRRNVAMVFQHYALFPHLTVARNIAYGLDARRVDRSTSGQRVSEMLALLKLDGLAQRYPAQLSGGQRQRVAIARALAIQPHVLLLDEAFSALDRNLREEMQLELSLLLRRLNVTTILVTHDQREAFSLGDRIAVMNAGYIAQIGTPREMYESPSDSYVLRFLGSINTLAAGLTSDDEGRARIRLGCGLEFSLDTVPQDLRGQSTTTVHLRTEDIGIVGLPTAVHSGAPAIVTLATFLGAHERIVATLAGQQIVIDRPANSGEYRELPVGAAIYLDFNPARCRLGGDR